MTRRNGYEKYFDSRQLHAVMRWRSVRIYEFVSYQPHGTAGHCE
jgi:hypothetical protein